MRIGIKYLDHKTRPRPVLIDMDTGDIVNGVKGIVIRASNASVTECVVTFVLQGDAVETENKGR